MLSRFFSFFALYFGFGFASPLLVVLANRDDIVFGPLWFAGISLSAVLALSFCSHYLAEKTRFARALATASLACALVLAIQGNGVHDVFSYGTFNGERVDWRGDYGWVFWAEWTVYLLAFPFFYWVLNRLRKIPVWLTLVPVLSSVLLVAPVLLKQQQSIPLGLEDDQVSTDVFEFSSKLNLVHLLPDGFQGDFARQVLEDRPALARQLAGFVFYRNHLGMYQGTAPAVPTLFMGRPFDLKAGYNAQRVVDELQQYAYPKQLLVDGFRLDFLTISPMFCLAGASTCVVRPFNDLKPRGYFRYKDKHLAYSLRLLADLSLFRQVPMFLKEKIYNGGNWLFSDTTLDGSSPWPDPVLREWTERMVVGDDKPRYKWYHYIGTHIPPHWDAQCVFHHDQPRTRQQYYNQAVCVLTGIAHFVDKLRQLGIYDQTAIIITADHGVNIEPDDIEGLRANGSMHLGVTGGSRPLFMVKPLNSNAAFQVSDLPTSFLDIAPTALDLVGLRGKFAGQAVSTIDPGVSRPRLFTPYASPEFWDGKPISFDTWEVDGSVRDLSHWSLKDVFYRKTAPASYPAMNFNSAFRTSRGLSLNRATPDVESAWIGGSEFVILVGTDQPEKPAVISMDLSMPGFMKDIHQEFTVNVNHQPLPDTFTFNQSKDWTHFEIPLPEGLLKMGNNLVKVTFVHTVRPKIRKRWHTAGKLKDFSLLQAK